MRVLLIIFVLLSPGAGCAESDAVFTAPTSYPVERYEAGWNKNPFTLKTATIALEAASFAKELVIGSYYGDASNPTVVLINTKTQERIRLKKAQPASNGMKLESVKLGGARKEIFAEVTLGSETSKIHFDDSYLKQMAAAEAAKTPPGQPRSPTLPTNGQPPPGQPPGQRAATPTPGAPATAQVAPGALQQPQYPGSGGRPFSTGVAPPLPGRLSAAAGSAGASVTINQSGTPAQSGSQPTPVAQNAPFRRGLISSGTNGTPSP